MDCATTQDHLAAWLDDELSPSARTLLELHLDRCATCQGLVSALAAQDFSRPDLAPLTSEGAFWLPLESVLDQEWSRQELATAEASRAEAPGPPWYRRSVRLPLPAVVAYAALTLLMAGLMFTGSPGDTMSTLAGVGSGDGIKPPPTITAALQTDDVLGTWPVATYTPHRGTF